MHITTEAEPPSVSTPVVAFVVTDNDLGDVFQIGQRPADPGVDP
jgi:hypothetical protein